MTQNLKVRCTHNTPNREVVIKAFGTNTNTKLYDRNSRRKILIFHRQDLRLFRWHIRALRRPPIRILTVKIEKILKESRGLKPKITNSLKLQSKNQNSNCGEMVKDGIKKKSRSNKSTTQPRMMPETEKDHFK